MTYHGIDNLRLEIERDPASGELYNLIQNPNGELGGWGWVTPLSSSRMSGSVGYVWYERTVSGASYFTSENMPVNAGQYVAARWDTETGGWPYGWYYRARFEWVNAAGTLISSSTQTGYYAFGATGTRAAVIAPANTAYVRLRFDLYDTNTGTAPGGTHSIGLKNVTVAKAATSGALVTSRTNLVANPSFETNINGWFELNGNNSKLARSTAFAASGTASMAVFGITWSPFRVNTVASYDVAGIQPGYDYTMQAVIRPTALLGTNSSNISVAIAWHDASGAFIGTTGSTYYTAVTNTWMNVSSTGTAPSNAAKARVRIAIDNINNTTGVTAYIDKVMLEQSSTVGTYIEGTQTTGSLPILDPTYWLNIMGPTYNIQQSAKEFDARTMTVNISDALLDPTVSTTIRPGRKIRLMVKDGSTWKPRFTGHIDDSNVKYPKSATGAVETLIEIRAVNNLTRLAEQDASSGVQNIADLPYILEGAGVPWNIDGSGNQVSSATVVSFNETAKLVDQIEIARSTNHGYAWVDNKNVLNVWSPNVIASSVLTTFSDTGAVGTIGYAPDIDVDWDMDTVINSVNIKFLTYDAANAQTKEVNYGPYQDADSIAQWKERSKDFTVHGAVNDNEPWRVAFANYVLAKNATPVIKANSLTMPVRDAASLTSAATLDLYSMVKVIYDTKVNTNYRITSIDEVITPQDWRITYGFGVDGSVVVPYETPSPPFYGVTTNNIGWNSSSPVNGGNIALGVNSGDVEIAKWITAHPAYTKRVFVNASVNARCPYGNQAVGYRLWYSANGGTVWVEIATSYVHNHNDAFLPLGTTLNGFVDIPAGTASGQLQFRLLAATGGGAGNTNFGMINMNATWFG